MLEFQEGFFEQEVRNGFYIDTTMKTVWAAELEVLQKVAEICDRHGFVWYAAYGTLLGAIRHEGFVPWDDDMDIWVKRGDYNKLLKILPEELPAGYFVRSPLTEEGYDQFHTLVNSGNRISIDKEWLEQYHGCPFSVGLDIFPLDYLARDEKERIMQENLVRIAARGMQVASTLLRASDNLAEDVEEKNALIKEIREGIRYLEDNCKVTIDCRLIEEEEWFKLASEFGKWENYFAMMYEEEESDYLVNFIDYVRWDWKKFPKEWFAEVYGATFENFMLPVPCGYRQALRRIYRKYEVIIKKTGTHDYPYYARQLQTLREMVRDREKQVQMQSITFSEDATVSESDTSLPLNWESCVQRGDGKQKKIILYANDVHTFLAEQEKALDKLEEVLHHFAAVKEQIALWWRPQRAMAERLETVSPALAERYRAILDCYRKAEWGICDETDNTDRAVEFCTAYYGEMNAILQPFQNAEKPILLTTAGTENRDADNNARINELRVFLSFSDYVEDDEKLYFASTNFNALAIVNKETWVLEKMIPFEDGNLIARNMHLRCVKRENKICFLPAGTQSIHIYDMENDMQSMYQFVNDDGTKQPEETWNYFSDARDIYLLPCCARQGIWKWKSSEDIVERELWWKLPYMDGVLRHGSVDEKRFFSLVAFSNQLYITDLELQTVEAFLLPDEKVSYITYDGEDFWYIVNGGFYIICWNDEQGIKSRYQVEGSDCEEQEMMNCQGICYAAGKIFFFEANSQSIYMLDKEKAAITKIHSIECTRGEFSEREMEINFKCAGNELVCMLRNAGDIVRIDLETLEVRQYNEDFHIDEDMQKKFYEIIFQKNALLYEEKGTIDLKMLLQHYMEK